MSLPARVATLVVAFLAVVAGVLWVVFDIVGSQPQTENYTAYAKNGAVDVTMMTTPQTTITNRPDWVSYFIKNPATGQFDHTTYFAVPANTTVNVTILGYDGCTPLRNPVWGKVAGVVNDAENLQIYNGKTMSSPQAITTFDSWADCSVQHTFAIPSLGINVPVASPPTVDENNALCGVPARALGPTPPRAARRTPSSSSPSRRRAPLAPTTGSASCRAAAVTWTATAAPWPRPVT